MIDARFSREAFESLRRPADRRRLAQDLASEIVATIAEVPTADGAFSAVLARLRLLGHHLYPRGDGRFGGGPDDPTGLEITFGPDGIEATWG